MNPKGDGAAHIFDPVLCELAYGWFCPPGGLILDPFAGGAVRGVVAANMGRRYLGVELSTAQVEANRAQAQAILGSHKHLHQPVWIVGDAREELPRLKERADFVFSCPPYFDLERFSNDQRDLSNMRPQDFVTAYRGIVWSACDRLLDDRFAAFVVSDVRAPDGSYRNLPGLTIDAFAAAKLKLHNDAVFVTAAGSLPMRVGRQFELSRKLGRMHQNLLVFVKGDPVKATKAIGACEFGKPGEDEEEASPA